MSHKPLTMNDRLINELFVILLSSSSKRFVHMFLSNLNERMMDSIFQTSVNLNVECVGSDQSCPPRGGLVQGWESVFLDNAQIHNTYNISSNNSLTNGLLMVSGSCLMAQGSCLKVCGPSFSVR